MYSEAEFIMEVFVVFLIVGFFGQSLVTRQQQLRLAYFFGIPGVLVAIVVLQRIPNWEILWIIPVIILIVVLGQLIPLFTPLFIPKRVKEKATEEETRLGYGLTGGAIVALLLFYQLGGGIAVGLVLLCVVVCLPFVLFRSRYKIHE